jgi:hypothetical protein
LLGISELKNSITDAGTKLDGIAIVSLVALAVAGVALFVAIAAYGHSHV